LRADEFPQFIEHALMHRRVADDAATLVGFGLAGFKLRFYERDNSAIGPQ